MKNKIAIIRIRGQIKIRHDIKGTLDMLRLYRKNYCVVLDSSPDNLGMIKKVKDYVTWGEIDDDTFKLLIEKRGVLYKGHKDTKIVVDGKKYKPFFRLQPPKGGFERKGIKIPFAVGGALGYRGKKINDLLKRMI